MQVGDPVAAVFNCLPNLSFDLQPVKVRRTRRAFRTSFPRLVEDDSKDDILPSAIVTDPTQGDDTTVTPNKNLVTNHKCGSACSTVTVGFSDQTVLEGWVTWIEQHITHEANVLLELLRTNSGYQFPARFPRNDDAKSYLSYFETVVASKGAIVPGKDER